MLNAPLTAANKHIWGEGFHPVPLNYNVPILFMRQQWTLWHFGNRVENIAPHKLISNHMDLGNQKKKMNMSKIRVVMEKLCQLATIKEVTLQNCDEVFDDASQKLLEILYPTSNNSSGHSDKKVTTIYEKMLEMKMGKRKFKNR